VEAKALVDTLDETLPVAHTQAEAEANSVNNTLLDVKAEALIDKPAVTL